MSSEELADRFHLLLRVRARDLAPPAGFVVQKGSAGAPPGVCRSVGKVCPSWGPHVEPGERKATSSLSRSDSTLPCTSHKAFLCLSSAG